jgi:ABC-type Co2+ transport system permease subunit
VLGYLTTEGTTPWVVVGIVVGVAALALRARSADPARRGLLLLVVVAAFLFAAIAIFVLAVSRSCAGIGGCMH